MFSLIITIISIALVGALAVASIYYGGDAFTRGTEKSGATALVNQYQQIKGAVDLYRVDKMEAPGDIDALTPDYLESAPAAGSNATGDWSYSSGAITVDGVDDNVCNYLNGLESDGTTALENGDQFPSFECDGASNIFQLASPTPAT